MWWYLLIFVCLKAKFWKKNVCYFQVIFYMFGIKDKSEAKCYSHPNVPDALDAGPHIHSSLFKIAL